MKTNSQQNERATLEASKSKSNKRDGSSADTLIQQLTSELNRINQGCGCSIRFIESKPNQTIMVCCSNEELCSICQGRKETLKKVSLMWADEMLKCMEDIEYSSIDMPILTKDEIDLKVSMFEQIKSLMEKA